jgi:hypothetical protein
VGLGVEGMATDAVSAGIIGAVFVLGLMIAGRLDDYKEAERAPTDLAAGLYAILRQGEAIHATWRKPDLTALRRRLIAVVTSLRAEIDSGDTRTAQAAIEELRVNRSARCYSRVLPPRRWRMSISTRRREAVRTADGRPHDRGRERTLRDGLPPGGDA